ncbi:MAG: ChbG/HpnK family deacetylase [Candidatus Omnitrophota bacterium]
MRKIIINADDFGLSKSINKGIIKAFKEGILTNTSLLPNMPGFDNAVDLITENPQLPVGIHLNIFRGNPILPALKLKSLTKKGSFFNNIFIFLYSIYAGNLDFKELESECRAQIEKLLKKNISITHLDSEKHLHLIKPIFDTTIKIAKEYGISKVRYINKIPYRNILGASGIFTNKFYNNLFLNIFSKQNRLSIQKCDLKTTDFFYGISRIDSNAIISEFKKVLLDLKNGTIEIMCHPGYIDEEWDNYPLNTEKYYLNNSREAELNALISPELKELIKKSNIKLIAFKDL